MNNFFLEEIRREPILKMKRHLFCYAIFFNVNGPFTVLSDSVIGNSFLGGESGALIRRGANYNSKRGAFKKQGANLNIYGILVFHNIGFSKCLN